MSQLATKRFLSTLGLVLLFLGGYVYFRGEFSINGGADHDAATENVETITRRLSEDQQQGGHLLPTVQFLFIVGIEGSGHHMLHELYHKSPSFQFLNKWNLWDKYDLCARLWNHDNPEKGLLTATISPEGKGSDRYYDGDKLIDDFTERIKAFANSIISEATKELENNPDADLPSTITVPLNSAKHLSVAGMMSYPNFFSKEGGAQHYPDLALIYKACRQAQADCRHFLVYRDPYEALRSTAFSRLFRSVGEQIKTMTTMNYVINAQLRDFPNELVYCWNFDSEFFESPDSHLIPNMLGWKNGTTFSKFYREFFTTPKAASETLLKSRNRVFMDLAIQANNRVIELCQDILKGQLSSDN